MKRDKILLPKNKKKKWGKISNEYHCFTADQISPIAKLYHSSVHNKANCLFKSDKRNVGISTIHDNLVNKTFL